MIDLLRAPGVPAQKGHNEFGTLPEWNLNDLYPGVESPELKRDLDWATVRGQGVRGGLQGQARSAGEGGQAFRGGGSVARSSAM